jgi:hypothetical protein
MGIVKNFWEVYLFGELLLLPTHHFYEQVLWKFCRVGPLLTQVHPPGPAPPSCVHLYGIVIAPIGKRQFLENQLLTNKTFSHFKY